MAGPRNATTTNRGRTYRWRDEQFDSVTTILSGGIPKPALTNWAAKSVAEYVADNLDQVAAICKKDTAAAIDLMKGSPWRARDKAADLGTNVHRYIEAHVLGKPMPDFPLLVAPFMEQFSAFVERFKPSFEASEVTVYNRRWGYAGTLDFLARVDDTLVLGDVKSGKGVYGETALQLAAYRMAEFIGMPDGTEVPMPEVDSCVVLHIRPDSYELIPVRAGDEEFRFFLYAAQIRNFCNEVSREVLGPPLNPGELGGELLVTRDEVPA